MDLSVALPDGTMLPGSGPIVVIGPNGSGKTRQVREITSPSGARIEVVNALRNTRVTTEVPTMGLKNARNSLNDQANQARSQFWELVSDFDVLLARLRAEDAAAAVAARDSMRQGLATAPPFSSLERLQAIWAELFPGRALRWNDNVPMVESTIGGTATSYQGNYMSDGEKAALYLAGKVLLAEPGVLIIDEPETHFHSLMAVEFWNALQAARADVRFVYVTHDLTFGLSRHDASFVIVGPSSPMRVLSGLDDLPKDVIEALVGAASFSFYARRVVICEGEIDGIDHELYRAWFRGIDTVVRPIGSAEMVIRSLAVLSHSNLVAGMEPGGIIDRDYHADDMLANLPAGVVVLPVHEVESLYCLPKVVEAVARHVGKAPFDAAGYAARVAKAVSTTERDRVVVERWKGRIEGPLLRLIGDVEARTTDLDATIAAIPAIFDPAGWTFSPQGMLADERKAVESMVPNGAVPEILALMPGKSLLSLPASILGLDKETYRKLVNLALAGGEGLASLGAELEIALATHLPERAV